jgi:hypothetical protein
MKRLSYFAKTQIVLVAMIATFFGLEANLRQIKPLECSVSSRHLSDQTSSHLEKLKCATTQTIHFVNIISQVFDKKDDRP